MIETFKLSVVHIASGDLWAGAEVQLATLASAQHNKLGMPVKVILLNHGRLEQQLQEAGIQVIVLDESKLNGFQILFRLVLTLRDLAPDVIHTHRLKENVLGSIAALIAGRRPSVRTVHGAPEHRPPWWKFPKRILYTLDRYCGRVLQRKIVAVSDDLASLLRKDFPPRHVCVIENGIDIEAIRRMATAVPWEDTAQGMLHVGIAGRLVPVKRMDLYIRTAQTFRTQHPGLDVCFHIFGDGPLRTELEQLSQALETEDIVQFEGHCEDIHSRMSSMDLLLLTSDHEGLPMIVLEAMGLDTPVIAHAVGGIPHLLDHGACGILVQDHSPAGYAKALYRLVNDPDHMAMIQQNASRRVTTHYSDSQNAQSYLDRYREIIR